MSEHSDRGRVVTALRSLDAFAVENSALPGTPDVNYVEGWIELKWVKHWPRRGGPVKLPDFFPEQRTFLRKRCEAGGAAHLLIHSQAEREWLLLPGALAARVVGSAAVDELRAAAEARWLGSQMEQEIALCLSKSRI